MGSELTRCLPPCTFLPLKHTRARVHTHTHTTHSLCCPLPAHRATPARSKRAVNMLEECRSVECYEKLNRISEGTYGVVYRWVVLGATGIQMY